MAETNIANKNMNRLNLNDRVKIYQGDATQFDGYGNYNVFYFFNELTASHVNYYSNFCFKKYGFMYFTLLLNHFITKDIQ